MNLILALLLLGSGSNETAVNSGTILMNIIGFESNDGQVVVALFTENEWSFPPDPSSAELTFSGEITGLSCDLEIPEITCGEYVAVAFHDLDRDGVFDMEEEAVGISGEMPQMSGTRSMPTFSDMSFTHSGSASSARITVRKMERPSGGPGGNGPRGGGGGGRPGGF